MLNLTYSDIPDDEAYAYDIGATGSSIYVDKEYIEALYYEYSALCASAQQELINNICTASHGKFQYISKQTIIDALVRYCECNEEDFVIDLRSYRKYKNEAGYTNNNPYRSLSMTSIVEPLLDTLAGKLNRVNASAADENAYLLLLSYRTYKHLETRVNMIRAKLNKFISKESYKGWIKPVHAVSFEYEQRSTGRFYTKNDSIQNWPLEMTKAITINDDYFLFWCDFDQIDFRVGYHLYLREPGSEADKIYLAETDKYRAMYTIICKSAGKTPDYDLFTKYRQAYKKAILSAMYNASEQALIKDIQNQELGHELYEFFKHNKKYQAYVQQINDNIKYNVDLIVRDYFGVSRSIPLPKLNDPSDVQKAVAQACNTPIQSTSNSIMELWLEKVLDTFESHGYKRGPDITPYLIRHDECIFKVHKSVMKDFWIFKDCMSVALDDWDILTLEPHAGLYYKTPHSLFESAYEQSCLQHANDFTTRTSKDPRPNTYRPISEVLKVYTHTLSSLPDIAYSWYCQYMNDIDIHVPDMDYKSWSKELCSEIIQQVTNISEAATRSMLLYNKFVLYSPKLDKYKCISGLADVCHLAHSIGTNKVICYTTNSNQSMIHDNIMFKVVVDNSGKLNSVLQSMQEQGFPRDWVHI